MSNQISVTTATGEQQSLANYTGRVLRIINTAGKCKITSPCQELHQLFLAFFKIGVRRPQANPVLTDLTAPRPRVLGNLIKWYFTKFLQENVQHCSAPTPSPNKLHRVSNKLLIQAKKYGY
jgi:glutathione peroxidase-family protein